MVRASSIFTLAWYALASCWTCAEHLPASCDLQPQGSRSADPSCTYPSTVEPFPHGALGTQFQVPAEQAVDRPYPR